MTYKRVELGTSNRVQSHSLIFSGFAGFDFPRLPYPSIT